MHQPQPHIAPSVRIHIYLSCLTVSLFVYCFVLFRTKKKAVMTTTKRRWTKATMAHHSKRNKRRPTPKASK